MTCIVGVEHGDGKVTIGADSQASTDEIKVARADTKLFAVGPYLIGYTSSFRLGQLLRYSLNPSRPVLDRLDEHMTTTFIDEVRCCLADGGFAEKANGVEHFAGSFLVAVAGHLYCIESDFQVGRGLEGYAACGSGENFAYGSLHTTSRYDFTPKRRVLLALEAAAAHNPFVGAPFVIQTAS